MKRIVSLWLPRFAIERHRRADGAATDAPTALVASVHGVQRVVAADAAAGSAGVVPGLSLADARALLPGLRTAEADPAADGRALAGLADWCTAFTPWTAVDAAMPPGTTPGGGAGLWLDVSGCAHLFGGEAALLAALRKRLAGFGLSARAAMADTAGAAWAIARFDGEAAGIVVPPGGQRAALAPLPVAALRLPAAVVEALHRVGLRRVGDLGALPRAPLADRFGAEVLRRLDQALGRTREPISPRLPVTLHRARLAFAEPVGRPEDLAAVLDRLLDELCAGLGRAHRGARRLELVLARVDGTAARLGVGTSRPLRDAAHLRRLFAEKLRDVDPRFGIETATLAATATDALGAIQNELVTGTERNDADGAGLARLVDRLANRLGEARVRRLAPRGSHLPERADAAVPVLEEAATGDGRWTCHRHAAPPRPLQMLVQPRPIEVVAMVPDGPPLRFACGRRQHRVVHAEGPERIAPEWWRLECGPDTGNGADGPPLETATRDYYRVEDADGRRFWIFRAGAYRADRPPRWFLHGVFA